MGEELGARGGKEGSGREKEEGGWRGPATAGASPASPEELRRARGGALHPYFAPKQNSGP